MTATVIDGIGLLVTNTAAGELAGAHVVIDGEQVVAVGTGPAPGRRRAHRRRRPLRHPRLRRQPHPPRVRRRPADEFAARMAGAPYEAGGINATIDATRAAGDDALRAAATRRGAPRPGAPASRRSRSSRATARPSTTRPAPGALAGELTHETTFLGAHVVPPEFAGRADDYVALVVRRDARRRRAARPLDRRLLRARGVRRRPVPRRAGGRAAPPGSGCGSTPTSSAPGPGVQLAVELGCASADHCTYLSDADVEALAASDTVATFLPATDFSTRQPYPDARRVIDAGATVALATNCNPGSSYTTSMSFVIALAVRDLRDDRRRGAARGDARRGPRPAPRRRRLARPRCPRRPRRARRAELRPPRLPAGRAR